MSPRWRKIWADLRINKARTILVVMSIVVGIFAVGSISGTAAIIDRESKALWEANNPASATLVTLPFGEDVLAQVAAMPEVAAVQARRSLDLRVQVNPGEFKDLRLFAVPDYQAINLNLIVDDATGAALPNMAQNVVYIERSAISLMNSAVGETLTVQLPSGETAALTVAGLAYDLSQPAASVLDIGYGYVSLETIQSLNGEPGFNILQFLTAENVGDEEHITSVANMIRDTLESQGTIVFSVIVLTPGEPPGYIFIVALLLVLGVIGSLTFVLSGFLIINIISALLAQQTRQIGIMKAVGARTGQIIGMYLGLAAIFGVFALLVGLPLSFVGARGLAGFIGELNNYKITDFSAPWWVFAVQIIIGLVVPVMAALVPVISGTRINVREALDSRGIDTDSNSIFDRMIARFQGLPRPVMLSFRNTFRQKGRLALTLLTLTLAGAIFATVFTVRNSLFNTLDDALGYDNYDVAITLTRPHPVDELTAATLAVDGVVAVDAWTSATGRLIDGDGGESGEIALQGLPPQSETIIPVMQAGRWLEESDSGSSAIVINGNVADALGASVGDEIAVVVRGQRITWQVVGIAQAVFSFENVAWTSYTSLADALDEAGLARTLRLTTTGSDADTQNSVAFAVSERLSMDGLLIDGTVTTAALKTSFDLRFNTLVGSLLALAGLLAIVGGLGITGTTSINVLERMREIGVMRSVGAADYQVLGIFVVEAVFVGFIGWLLGALMALPISRLLSDGVGNAFSNAPLAYSFDVSGAVLWLVLAIGLAFMASYFPARRASKLTLREVLAYEG